MKLWTKELSNKAKKYPLYSQDGKGYEAEVITCYFNPYGRGTWIITEAEEQEDGEVLMFGLCHITEWEWGYISLNELASVKVDVFGCKLPLERDLYMGSSKTVADVLRVKLGEDWQSLVS